MLENNVLQIYLLIFGHILPYLDITELNKMNHQKSIDIKHS
jgi:hypothetical protein